MPTHHQAQVAKRVREKGPHPDLTKKTSQADTASALQRELEQAKKKLEQKIALQDHKAVEKLNQIIANLEGTIARQKLQQQKI